MSVTVTLGKKLVDKPLAVGDSITIEVLIDEKIGAAGDAWKVDANERWLSAGGITLDSRSLEQLPSDGSFTKLAIKGIIHQDGKLSLTPIVISHEQSKKQFTIAGD